jgi:hypothetical protein
MTTAYQIAREISILPESEFQKLVSMIFRAQREHPHKTYSIADRWAIYAGLCSAWIQPASDV